MTPTPQPRADFQPLPQNILQIKGYLSGFIAGGICNEGKAWMDTLNGLFNLGLEDAAPLRNVLIDLYKEIAKNLHEKTFDLRSFIFKRKKLPFNHQVFALKQWCTGFLTGFPSHALPSSIHQTLRNELKSFEGVSSLSVKKIITEEKNKKLFLEALDFIEYTLLHVYLLLNENHAKH